MPSVGPGTGVPAFELEDVSFAYEGSVPALESVSLRVDRGESLAILGANGSGKSTALRVLAGLVHPQSGTVRAFGDAITEAALSEEAFAFRFRRRVGLVFQHADAQLFSPTVREEIAFGPLQLGLAREEVERRISDAAGMLGIGGLLDRPPYRLSGGEKKKVAIVSVLVTSPEAILLDEPMGGLDPRTQRWLVEFLEALHQAGKTLVVATNDLDILPEVASRVVVLSESHRVAAAGTVAEVLADASLLHEANVIHEHTHRHGGRLHSHAHFHGGDHAHEH